MYSIVLSTLNAKYIHTAFGLRYLLANMGELQSETRLIEFDIKDRPIDIAERLLAEDPRIIGLGVYIWNVAPTQQLVALIKRIAPAVVIVLGGPEVSFESDGQAIVTMADFVICGEGELSFPKLCQAILRGQPPLTKIIPPELPRLDDIKLPYQHYSDEDLKQRIIYVEASRGCPFTCEFCLSSLDEKVRPFPLDTFLVEIERLLARGASHFKFVDRTFNLNIHTGVRILEFFLERFRQGLFLHFEMIPDRLPPQLRTLIAQFPNGALQFEVGIQTFNSEVSALISRKNDFAKVEDNFHFLKHKTGVHIHADLIAGLPGEDLASFAAGFDRLIKLGPQEIQVGILKRLKGTPLARHDVAWAMVYSPEPPYEILQNKNLDFPTLQRLRRFSRYWDLVANSGNFRETLPLIIEGDSAFSAFMFFSDWLFLKVGKRSGIALPALAEFLLNYLTEHCGFQAANVAERLVADFTRVPGREPPPTIRSLATMTISNHMKTREKGLPKRQSLHLHRPESESYVARSHLSQLLADEPAAGKDGGRIPK